MTMTNLHYFGLQWFRVQDEIGDSPVGPLVHGLMGSYIIIPYQYVLLLWYVRSVHILFYGSFGTKTWGCVQNCAIQFNSYSCMPWNLHIHNHHGIICDRTLHQGRCTPLPTDLTMALVIRGSREGRHHLPASIVSHCASGHDVMRVACGVQREILRQS